MPEDQAGAERELTGTSAERQTAEERRLSEALAELRQVAIAPGEEASAEAQAEELASEEDAADTKALEEDHLSSWVATTRASAAADAKAWEEDALKTWVAQARADAPAPAERPEPARKAPRRKTAARKPPAKTSRSSKPRTKRAKPAPVPEPASDTLPQTLTSTEPVQLPAGPVSADPNAFERAVRSFRLALGWHFAELLQRASPAARVRRLIGTLWRLANRVAGLLLRVLMAAGKLPLRFVSELDLPGLIGLLLAIAGVIAVLALLMRG